ncbi:unnamed protein product [Didymodactylos carnosus]|uniref:Ubiquitin carboxyl-terminal hydrolase n=1 Tax=Didymodactylos carnosus TaxID=1234261 RepID=A0A814ECU9_9BILA|nr:unnamed protein product [Didymodactylos carnosus]CAF1048417.1 unnamed protein product [Didymodactylos carnosus]CAF3738422.1 unnamed protein product [Didymodactylos carnosus]CAF3815991.1 unnamed protein product [Didymodactylos carnosus]
MSLVNTVSNPGLSPTLCTASGANNRQIKDSYSSSPDKEILAFKVCKTQRSKSDIIFVAMCSTHTLKQLKERIIHNSSWYPLTFNDIVLTVFSNIENTWIDVKNDNDNEQLLNLNLHHNDYINVEKLETKSNRLITDYSKSSITTISQSQKKFKFKLCEKVFMMENYIVLIDIPATSTIMWLKQKSSERLQLYISNLYINLFVYDDEKNMWTKFDSTVDDCTLEELHFKNHKFICIETENDHSRIKTKTNENYLYTPGLCGLTNIGNTCYMNSALQCLSNIPQLTEYYRNLSVTNNEQSIINVYSKLLKQMWSGQFSYVKPKQLKNIISQYAPIFTDNRQKDSHEFMNFLLNALHQEQTSSIISQLFHGQIASTVTCLTCQKIEIKHELFNFLSLSINQKQIFEIHYFQLNGNQEQFLIDISIQHTTTISILIDEFICMYNPNLNKEQLLPVTLDKNCIKYRYKFFDYLIDITKNQLSLLQLPLIINSNEQTYISCLFMDIDTKNSFRPPIFLLRSKYMCRTIDFKQQINKLLNHLETTINKSKIDYKLYWTNLYGKKFNLNLNEDELLSDIDTITIGLKNILTQKYQFKQDKKFRSLTPSFVSTSLTLDKLLENFFKEDFLNDDYYCSKCIKMTQCKQKSNLCLTLPPVIIIQLKRFTYNDYSNEKINSFIEYPIYNLNLNQYLIKETNNDKCLYDLIAVLNHNGNLSFGHYITYAKNNITQRWYSFNDSYLQEIEEKNLITADAYILVYIKQQTKS